MMSSNCRGEVHRLYIYADGFYSLQAGYGREEYKGLKPFIEVKLRICNGNNIEGIEVVKYNSKASIRIDLSKCIEALRERGLIADSTRLVDYSHLLDPDNLRELISEDKCNGLDNLTLVLALYAAEHRTLTGKRVIDALLEVLKRE